MPNLNKLYTEKIVPEFMKENNIKSPMAVPRVLKVVVNVGIGKNRGNKAFIDQVKENLAAITGQKPAIRKSRKAISGFKVRIGEEVGLSVTLRGKKMYDFLDKLANVTLPRLRDFRGLNQKSINNGGFTLGIKEHLVFPEVSHSAEVIHGLEVSIVTSAKNASDAEKLIKGLGFPFQQVSKENK